MFEFLNEAEEDQTVEHPVSVEGLKGNVTFDHVHFGYEPNKIIINDFSTEVKEGQKIAIVGPTGAGKTTMIKLLMRFYDVNSGAILVDGHNLKDFNRSELRQMLEWSSRIHGFSTAALRKISAMEDWMLQMKKSKRQQRRLMHRFIQTLPGGYDMELNEEATNVSQGQKQLLTIARAIFRSEDFDS